MTVDIIQNPKYLHIMNAFIHRTKCFFFFFVKGRRKTLNYSSTEGRKGQRLDVSEVASGLLDDSWMEKGLSYNCLESAEQC